MIPNKIILGLNTTCFLLLVTFVSGSRSLADNVDPQKTFEQSYSDWTKDHSEFRGKLEDLYQRADELSVIFMEAVKLDAEEKELKSRLQLEKDSDKKVTLMAKQKELDDRISKYTTTLAPIFYIFADQEIISQPFVKYKDNGMHVLADRGQIKQEVQSMISKWDHYSPASCIDTSSGTAKFVQSHACSEYLTWCKGAMYSSKNGQLVLLGLEKDLSVTEHEVTDIDDDLKFRGSTGTLDTGSFWPKERFDACRTLSAVGETFSSDEFVNEPSYSDRPKWVNELWITPESEATFKDECISAMPSETEKANFLELQQKYPKYFWLDSWKKGYAQRQALCGSAAQLICGHTFSIKSKRILSYVTVACKVQDVTADDVQNQLEYMQNEAARLLQSSMIDTIEVCDQAEAAGYSWDYFPPRIPKNCKAEE